MSDWDTSELDDFARDLAAMDQHITRKVKPAVKKAGVKMKAAWQADAASSKHFAKIAPSISFDIEEDTNGVAVEVGPVPSSRRAAYLENIWLFGGVNGGGGTGKEPMVYLDDEVPHLENSLGDVVEEVWGQ